MGQKDTSPSASYIREVRSVLDRRMGLVMPEAVLEAAARRAYATGLFASEAAIRICHEHSQLLSQKLVDEDRMASDLTEFAIASRIDESANLASETGQDLLDMLPDLPTFVGQACFSDEFREMVAHIATWHGIPEHRWSPLAARVGLFGSATA